MRTDYDATKDEFAQQSTDHNEKRILKEGRQQKNGKLNVNRFDDQRHWIQKCDNYFSTAYTHIVKNNLNCWLIHLINVNNRLIDDGFKGRTCKNASSKCQFADPAKTGSFLWQFSFRDGRQKSCLNIFLGKTNVASKVWRTIQFHINWPAKMAAYKMKRLCHSLGSRTILPGASAILNVHF